MKAVKGLMLGSGLPYAADTQSPSGPISEPGAKHSAQRPNVTSDQRTVATWRA